MNLAGLSETPFAPMTARWKRWLLGDWGTAASSSLVVMMELCGFGMSVEKLQTELLLATRLG
jgi:hypothetical protein